DLAQYVHEQYAQYNHPFFVVLANGRVISSGSAAMPEPLLAMARSQLARWAERPPMRRFERGEPPRFGRVPEQPADGTGVGSPVPDAAPVVGSPPPSRLQRGPGGMPFGRPAPFVRSAPTVLPN